MADVGACGGSRFYVIFLPMMRPGRRQYRLKAKHASGNGRINRAILLLLLPGPERYWVGDPQG